MSLYTREKRKELGAYYTPQNLSQILTDWAIRTPTDKIFEPSFGGCGFLETSVKSLKELHCRSPASRLFGADIDKQAFNFLSNKLGSVASVSGRFICKDFIKTTPKDYGRSLFDVVIGNPPYVSLHNMSTEQRESCFDILRKSPFTGNSIGRNVSLWAFFMLHALSFLKDKGRVAWVLPSSLLHANYAKVLLKSYQKHFHSIKIVKLNQRLFQDVGADEISVILLADDFSEKERNFCSISYSVCEDIESLKEQVFSTTKLLAIQQSNYKYSILPSELIIHYQNICQNKHSVQLGELSNIVIGMVTGDNNTFIVDKDKVKEYKLNKRDLKPVIDRFSQLKGLIHNKTRHDSLIQEGKRCMLVCPQNIKRKATPIRKYLATVNKNNRQFNRTFPKRLNWFYPDDHRYPDAFLSYMIHETPRLVINSAKVNCTNSVHRVFFKKKLSHIHKKALAMSILSSFSQLSAELEAKAYGSGVLKLEPTPAKKIRVLMSAKIIDALSTKATEIDLLLIRDMYDEARKIVDAVICAAESLSINTFNRFNEAIVILRNERYKGLKGN